MTQQTLTAAVSAVWFLLLAIAIALSPTPFVTYAPGASYDLLGSAEGETIVEVSGVPTYPATGRIMAATVSVTPLGGTVTLPEVLYAHWAPDRDAVLREWHYPTRTTIAELRERDVQRLAAAQTNAAASALRAAGVEVRQIPMVQTVAQAGPAVNLLVPGDFVLAVDDVPLATVAEVRAAMESRPVGAPVTLTVLRGQENLTVTIETTSSNTSPTVPVWGGTLTMGFSYTPEVTFHLDPTVGGGSGGLMLALATFDRITDGGLVGDLTVSGTGVLDGAGAVSRSSGVVEKLAVAERDGASVFVLPAANCADIADTPTPLRLVSVANLDDAIAALDALAAGDDTGAVEGCA
ncbi:PDZ domain-containing protein [Propioniciclava soli]|uniref:PDZ domain-containing protein n=1 Tax=Propioniciclava soli TaxID=2775081 RepID=UPI001E5E4E3B|nr:PDZ domain-containing protein [Propioniciclava soli]